nr:substrate-binding domain-containing protein [Chryseolinea lacunae]
MASALRTGRTGLIGILVPGIHYSFFSSAIKGAEEVLSDAGYSVMISQSKDSQEQEKKQLDGFVRANVEGVIASLGMETKQVGFYQEFSKDRPLVLFDRVFEDESISNIVIDDFQAAVKVVDHLAEMGYRRIAHLGGYSHILAFNKRMEGYKYGLVKHGLPVLDHFIFESSPDKDFAMAVMESLFNLPDPPDAVVAASDYLALGVLNFAKSRQIDVPGQLGIVGFSNEELTKHITPSLTTVDQFSEAMGQAAAELLLDQISCIHKGQEAVSQRRVFIPKLIVRDSTRRELHLANDE